MFYTLTRLLISYRHVHRQGRAGGVSPGGAGGDAVPPGLPQDPEVVNVSFKKVNGSMGLSIVAAKVSPAGVLCMSYLSCKSCVYVLSVCVSCLCLLSVSPVCVSCLCVLSVCPVCVSCLRVLSVCPVCVSCLCVLSVCPVCVSCLRVLSVLFCLVSCLVSYNMCPVFITSVSCLCVLSVCPVYMSCLCPLCVSCVISFYVCVCVSCLL